MTIHWALGATIFIFSPVVTASTRYFEYTEGIVKEEERMISAPMDDGSDKAGGKSSALSADSSFKPALGWILVESASVEDVETAIAEYDELAGNVHPGVFRVELHPQSRGAVAVVLPDGLPAYDLTNMTSWLNALPGQEGDDGAASWITAPGNGMKYYLEPETSNPSGDTLIGASMLGQSVRVSLPETGLSEASASVRYREEPQIEISPLPLVIELTLDTDTAFGNSEFVVNSAKEP